MSTPGGTSAGSLTMASECVMPQHPITDRNGRSAPRLGLAGDRAEEHPGAVAVGGLRVLRAPQADMAHRRAGALVGRHDLQPLEEPLDLRLRPQVDRLRGALVLLLSGCHRTRRQLLVRNMRQRQVTARRERVRYRRTRPHGSDPSATKWTTAVISSPAGSAKSISRPTSGWPSTASGSRRSAVTTAVRCA